MQNMLAKLFRITLELLGSRYNQFLSIWNTYLCRHLLIEACKVKCRLLLSG